MKSELEWSTSAGVRPGGINRQRIEQSPLAVGFASERDRTRKLTVWVDFDELGRLDGSRAGERERQYELDDSGSTD